MSHDEMLDHLRRRLAETRDLHREEPRLGLDAHAKDRPELRARLDALLEANGGLATPAMQETDEEGESGWQFHDWLAYQPDARTLQLVRDAESKAGSLGNHKRWHANRRINDPLCDHCNNTPSGEATA